MQNTVAIGAILYLANLGMEEAHNLMAETFGHKGEKVVSLNVELLKVGFEHAKKNAKPFTKEWKFSKKRRPFVTGNEVTAIAAAAAGCKFYSAYPMTPASTILHWMANHTKQTGIVVKQGEDELAVMNMTIGAGIAGVRSMCATAGGGFALMTEALGMAASWKSRWFAWKYSAAVLQRLADKDRTSRLVPGLRSIARRVSPLDRCPARHR